MMVLRTVINQLAVHSRNQNRESRQINGLINTCPARGEKQNDNGQSGINNVTLGTVVCVRLQFYAVKNSFMGGYFILFPIFYFSGTFKQCPGHRDRHAISETILVNPGRITYMP